MRDNPYPGETNPKLLHAVFLPEVPGPGLAAWVADAERQVRANGSRDGAQVLGRTVYLHTPDGYPPSELRRALARAGGPTSASVAGTARNWATVSRLVELCVPDLRARSDHVTSMNGRSVNDTATEAQPAPYGRVFDEIAAEYDRRRPAYPDELVDHACHGRRHRDR